MDYTNDPSTNPHPDQHDYDELVAIYGHLDNTTSVRAAAPNGQTQVGNDRPAGASELRAPAGLPRHLCSGLRQRHGGHHLRDVGPTPCSLRRWRVARLRCGRDRSEPDRELIWIVIPNGNRGSVEDGNEVRMMGPCGYRPLRAESDDGAVLGYLDGPCRVENWTLTTFEPLTPDDRATSGIAEGDRAAQRSRKLGGGPSPALRLRAVWLRPVVGSSRASPE
jgi:hypothetical protein